MQSMGTLSQVERVGAKNLIGGESLGEELSGKRVLEELAAIAFARTTDFYGEDWSAVQTVDSAAVACVEKGPTGVKLKFYDKLKALELLGKHLGLFTGVAMEGPEMKQGILEAFLKEDGDGISFPQCQTEIGA